jgi:hypothetical protein
MLSVRTLLAVAILPLLAGPSWAQQAAPQMDRVTAIRAECFRQANAAAQAQIGMASANPAATAAGNSVGANAYYTCIRKNGLRR